MRRMSEYARQVARDNTTPASQVNSGSSGVPNSIPSASSSATRLTMATSEGSSRQQLQSGQSQSTPSAWQSFANERPMRALNEREAYLARETGQVTSQTTNAPAPGLNGSGWAPRSYTPAGIGSQTENLGIRVHPSLLRSLTQIQTPTQSANLGVRAYTVGLGPALQSQAQIQAPTQLATQRTVPYRPHPSSLAQPQSLIPSQVDSNQIRAPFIPRHMNHTPTAPAAHSQPSPIYQHFRPAAGASAQLVDRQPGDFVRDYHVESWRHGIEAPGLEAIPAPKVVKSPSRTPDDPDEVVVFRGERGGRMEEGTWAGGGGVGRTGDPIVVVCC